MSHGLPETGQATALMLVGLMVLAIPAGLALAQGLTESSTATDTATVVTPTLPPVNLTATQTPTATPTPDGGEGGDDNETGGNVTTGETLYVNIGGGVADGVTSEKTCATAKYTSIQAAVDAGEQGDTVVVCPGTYSEHVKVTTANLTIRAIANATITNANESAVWINAPGVTLQGFNIRVSEGADYAIEVGGKEAVIRDNFVNSPGVGIFLSDGHTETGECRVDDRIVPSHCDSSPPVNPDLGGATGGEVLNNIVTAGMIRIWADADQSLIQNNFVTDKETSENPENYPDCRTRNPFFECPNRFNDSIVSSGNDTIVRGNTIRIDRQATGVEESSSGIQLGKTPTQDHNMATNNTVVANSIDSSLGRGIHTRNITAGSLIRNNSFTETSAAIFVTDQAIVRNNDIRSNSLLYGIFINSFKFAEVRNYQEKQVLVINNTIEGGNSAFGGIWARWDAIIKRNTIKNFTQFGVEFGTCRGGGGRLVENKITENNEGGAFFTATGVKISDDDLDTGEGLCPIPRQKKQIEILNNEITNNEFGIHLRHGTDEQDVYPVNNSLIEIHGNLINNNEDLGINNGNESRIVDATNNIWACGGPSGGANPLADPYTGRLANGSGDLISAGNGSTRNDHPISNVHFDPFQELASCSGSQQPPTPTPTLTPTPTPTPTATPTPSSTPLAGSGNGTAETGGSGTGGEGSGTAGAGSSGETSEETPRAGTPPPTPSTPEETQTKTPTISPTPQVEPGFGAITLIVAVAMLGSVIALRRRTQAESVASND